MKKKTIPALILALVQTLCLLLYPACAARLLDVGVRKSGYTSVVPERLRSQTFSDLRLFMSTGDYKTLSEAYEDENGVSTLKPDADIASLERLLPEAEVRYLRLSQQGPNAIAAARSALESGVMTQSQIIEKAERDGSVADLTDDQLKTAAGAFLRSEASVLGDDPGHTRNVYIWRVVGILAIGAALYYVCGVLGRRLRMPDVRLAEAVLLSVGAILVMLYYMLRQGTLPGAWAACVLALAQLLLCWIPASMKKNADLPAAAGGKAWILAALPSLLATAAAVSGFLALRVGTGAVNTLSAAASQAISGGEGSLASFRNDMVPGAILLGAGLICALLAVLAYRKQKTAIPEPVGGVLAVLPAAGVMAAALIVLLLLRFWLAAAALVTLAGAWLVYVRLLNDRAVLREPLIHLIGHLGCICAAGFASAAAGTGSLTIGACAGCMLCMLVFTRVQSKLLTH